VVLYLVDQPNRHDRHDYAQYRESNPESNFVAPHWITDAQELWAGPLYHKGRIGNFFLKLYAAPNPRAAHSAQ
jgi:hypothetical protein